MARLIMFGILAVVILFSAVMSVMTKRIMRSVTYLFFALLGIAGLYFVMGYTYLGAAQIAVYAGGITMLFIFSIQLVSKNSLQGLVERFKGSRVLSGVLISVIGLVMMIVIFLKNQAISLCVPLSGDKDVEMPMEQVGTALIGADKFQYILPFEFISVFLLACIIGGIMIARKEDKK